MFQASVVLLLTCSSLLLVELANAKPSTSRVIIHSKDDHGITTDTTKAVKEGSIFVPTQLPASVNNYYGREYPSVSLNTLFQVARSNAATRTLITKSLERQGFDIKQINELIDHGRTTQKGQIVVLDDLRKLCCPF